MSIGILSLDTRFPRIPGDVGNPETWPFPVLIRVVSGATPERVVMGRAEGLLDDFAAAARRLVAEGVDGIVTTCGFLTLMQADLQNAVPVPVATSSLLQVPLVARLLPPGRVPGILTVSARSLTEAHLLAAGVDPATPVMGTDGGREFSRVFLGNETHLDVAAAEDDVVSAAKALVERHPEVGAIVMECTNMGPYAAAVREATGRPVYDIVSFVTWFRQGLAPRTFRR